MSLVQSFNELPRKPKALNGMVPNVWHFDIRYVQLEPTPTHVVAIIQPKSLFFHMERLPVGLPTNVSGIEFFPESAKDAAPEVAKALVHAFVNNLGHYDGVQNPDMPPPYAPWKLTTEDKELAVAVGKELRRIGVHSEELCKIGVSTTSVNLTMQLHFHRLFQKLKKAIGIEDLISAEIRTPTSISFHIIPVFRQRHEMSSDEETDQEHYLTSLCLKYMTELEKSRPHKDGESYTSNISGRMDSIRKKIVEKPARIVKAEADRGDPEAAFDYGVRILVGLCRYDRTLARKYLIKALLSPNASDELKCTAHGILIDWYVFGADTLPQRYIFTASHHANLAASLARRIPDVSTPSSVSWFMMRVFHPFSEEIPELCFWYKDCQNTRNVRDSALTREKEKMDVKRLKNPNRYRCAAVGCGIEANAGKMLLRCSGKCDVDKKPSYCSKECQRADWKNHKSFCKPGMPCSVIDGDLNSGEGTVPTLKKGTIQVPITLSGGTTMRVASSTMDPKLLKEVKDHIESLSDQRPISLPTNMTFELNRFM